MTFSIEKFKDSMLQSLFDTEAVIAQCPSCTSPECVMWKEGQSTYFQCHCCGLNATMVKTEVSFEDAIRD